MSSVYFFAIFLTKLSSLNSNKKFTGSKKVKVNSVVWRKSEINFGLLKLLGHLKQIISNRKEGVNK